MELEERVRVLEADVEAMFTELLATRIVLNSIVATHPRFDEMQLLASRHFEGITANPPAGLNSARLVALRAAFDLMLSGAPLPPGALSTYLRGLIDPKTP